jgi:small GTP-binding protein
MSEKKENKSIPMKIILLGETGTGKTSLINNYFGRKFCENEESSISSEVSTKLLEIDQVKYTIDIWDTCGQERYHSVTKLFIKESKIVIFIYNITKMKTFELLDYWVKTTGEILNNNNDVIYGVVGNKADLFEQQEVEKNQGENFAKEVGALFLETSAKEDKLGFKQFVNKLIEKSIGKKCFDKNSDSNNKEENKKLSSKNKDKKKKGCC